MATHDEVHKDLYDKINACTAEMKELTGAVRILTQQNEKFFDIIEKQNERQQKIIKWAFGIVILCLLIIGYGAIGKEGMASVRRSLPSLPGHEDKTTYAIPVSNDIDKWRAAHLHKS